MVTATFLALMSTSAFAEDDPRDQVPYEEKNPLWDLLEAAPPRASFDIGVGFGFGEITHYHHTVAPWLGFGLHGTWGRHVGSNFQDRLGVGLSFGIEGPIPEYFNLVTEPAFAWDRVLKPKIQIGASVGPALFVHSNLGVDKQEYDFNVGPAAAFRFGYSEKFGVGKPRFFVLLEPKVRWIESRASWFVGIVAGSGNGY